jgi:predicted transcriptional regulator
MVKYKVGQILYMASKKSFKIIPVQVVEEVIRTTVNGRIKTYMIMFPDNGNTIIDIENIKSDLFKTEKEIKDHMIKNATKAIEELIVTANELKNQKFPTNQPEPSSKENIADELLENVNEAEDSDTINVDLGNGTVAKMNVNNLMKVGGN